MNSEIFNYSTNKFIIIFFFFFVFFFFFFFFSFWKMVN